MVTGELIELDDETSTNHFEVRRLSVTGRVALVGRHATQYTKLRRTLFFRNSRPPGRMISRSLEVGKQRKTNGFMRDSNPVT